MRTDCNSWQNHTIRSKLSKDNYVPTVAIGDELFIDIYSSEGDREWPVIAYNHTITFMKWAYTRGLNRFADIGSQMGDSKQSRIHATPEWIQITS